jgi:hypothetical protein
MINERIAVPQIHTILRTGNHVRDLILDRCCILVVPNVSADGSDLRASRFTPNWNLSLWRVINGNCSFTRKHHADSLLDLRNVGRKLHQQECAQAAKCGG